MDSMSPKIDQKTFIQMLQQLRDLAPHYIPEWQPEDETKSDAPETEPGAALMKIFSQIVTAVISRLNRAPERNLVYFLDMLGFKLLPALPARVPLTFKLAPGPDQGLGRELLVPQRTQATADATDERPEQLPFETEEDLLVTPSLLTQVIGVDPLQDAIYQPPPGFLERPLPVESQTTYKIISFSLAGSDTLQLDTVAGLKEGDLLRIGPFTPDTLSGGMQCSVNLSDDNSLNAGASQPADFFYIEEIKGSLVKIKGEKLPRDYQPGTPIEKVVKFHLFQSKNLQEHVLYLGHSDLFNIKSPAQFTLNITHLAGTEAGVQPLAIAWEYWGLIEGEEGEDWHRLEVAEDGSVNLSRSGTIILKKVDEGEITVHKVNDVESRWVRCRLTESLPVNDNRRLPVLDNIAFLVQSTGEFFADQAFNNDTPLDVALQFLPFGSEPRLFDRFYVASKEAFSKQGAKITINISVDTRGTLAAPTAITVKDDQQNTIVKVFSRGTRGRLVELEIDPSGKKSPRWTDHGLPPDTSIALPDLEIGTEALPAVVNYRSEVSITLGLNASIVDNAYRGFPITITSGTGSGQNRIIIAYDGSTKVATIDRGWNTVPDKTSVYAIGISHVGTAQSGTSSGITLDKGASAIDGFYNGLQIRITGGAGSGQERTIIDYNGTMKIAIVNPLWATIPDNTSQYQISSVMGTAQSSADQILVFAKAENGHLVELFIEHFSDPQQEPKTAWYDHGTPQNTTIKFDPSAVRSGPDSVAVYVTGEDGKLYVFERREGTTGFWRNSEANQNTVSLGSSPYAVFSEEVTPFPIKVFAKGQLDGILYEWDSRDWKNYNTDGLPQARQFKVISRPFARLYSVVENGIRVFYAKVFVVDEAGNLNELDTRELDTAQRWTSLESPSNEIELASNPHGFVKNPQNPVTSEDKHIFVRGSNREGKDSKLWEKTDAAEWISHQSPLITEPRHSPFAFEEGASRFVFSGSNKNSIIERRIQLPVGLTGTAKVGTNRTLTLDDNASTNTNEYAGMQIEIATGVGNGQKKMIESYDGTTRVARVDTPWTTELDSSSNYRIKQIEHAGRARGGAFSSITLDSNASNSDDAYNGLTVEIIGGTGTGQTKTIVGYDGITKIATVDAAWATIPNHSSNYRINTGHSGTAQGGTIASITLAATASGNNGIYNGLTIEITGGKGVGQIKTIISYDGATKIAQVNSNWNTDQIPDTSSSYQIENLSGDVQTASNANITLGANASDVDGAYDGLTIEITGGTGTGQTNTISEYDGDTKIAKVASAWTVPPDDASDYQINTAHASTAQGGAAASIILAETAVDINDAYKGFTIEIIDGTGAPQGPFPISKYDGMTKVATINQTWNTIPDSTSIYAINTDHNGTAQAATNNSIKLQEDIASDINGFYEGSEITITSGSAADQKRTIKSYNGETKNAEVDPAWNGTPDQYSDYEIGPYRNTAQGGTNISTITLAGTASGNDGIYNGLEIRITGGTGADQAKTIVDYNGTSKIAEVASSWTTVPDDTSKYEIDAYDDTAQSGENSSITLANNAPAINDAYKGLMIKITEGMGKDQTNTINEYNGSTKIATVASSWTIVPDTTSRYEIVTEHDGKAQDAANSTITLANSASSINGIYEGLEIKITGGTGAGQTNTIVDYDGTTKIATVKTVWSIVPDNTSRYEIGGLEGQAQDGTGSTIQLATDASSDNDSYPNKEIQLISGTGNGQVQNIIAYDGATKIAEVMPAWTTVPDGSTEYRILEPTPENEGKARVGTDKTITLDQVAPSIDGIFNGRLITITGGLGSGQTNVITDYIGSDKVAIVNKIWTTRPDTTSTYAIAGEIIALWNSYDDPVDVSITPKLSWEYWNGKGWVVFKEKVIDSTKNLLIDGTIEFILPDDLEITDVSGQENLWIRARIVGGDYGRETFKLVEVVAQTPEGAVKETTLVPSKEPIRPPFIVSLTIGYELLENQFPKQCLPFNNLQYIDQTGANKTDDKQFLPFERLEDTDKTIYLGFSQAFKGGPIKIFFIAQELPFNETEKPKMVWMYRGANEWKRLSVDDATEGLVKQEILKLISEKDLTILRRFGSELFWIRGGLTAGRYLELPVLDGIYPNTTWTFQAETFRNEILGSSDGEPNQVFQFQNFPILPGDEKRGLQGEEVRVQEVLTNEEREDLQKKFGEEAVFDEKDEKGEIVRTWVLWQEVPGFFNSETTDRHYTLDRATGQLQFGDGQNGRIPPAGLDTVQAFSYQAVIGGAKGNVKAGEIQTLVTATAGVDAVINTVAAGGGTDTATLDQMLQIGPAMISHKDRAVTPEDFEWLAKQASREVVKARCLANVNAQKQNEIGWVSIYIVPNLPEMEMPIPSLEMRRSVQRYLEARSANTIAALRHINVEVPVYQPVSVTVEVIVDSIDVAARVDQEVRAKLKKFFHPLTGGPNSDGWDFGRDVSASDVYVLLEDVEGVDHVEGLQFNYNGTAEADVVTIKPDFLVANGEHTVNIKLRNER